MSIPVVLLNTLLFMGDAVSEVVFMNNHSGSTRPSSEDRVHSVWTQSAQFPRFPSLKQDMKTDVLVIGGGIAGLLCAYLLECSGVPYVLAEAKRL